MTAAGLSLLLDALAAAVPLEIEQARWMDEECRTALARSGQFSPAVQEGADDLLYGAPRCAQSFATLTRGLALLAYQPGGVRFGPLHWCAAHPRQREVTGQICAACLAGERAGRPAQERAEGECAPALDAAREHLDGLIKQAHGAATERHENGD